jgi:nicotinate dehydrogenase subunit A
VANKKHVLNINGKRHETTAAADSALLYYLRDELALRGPRFGCGLAQCGACTVIYQGKTIRSCITPISAVTSGRVTTLEGLRDGTHISAVQEAFIHEDAAQCGYCTNGMVMASTVLLQDNPHPSEDEIKKGLAPWLCRCGTHYRIVRAVQRAARTRAEKAKA